MCAHETNSDTSVLDQADAQCIPGITSGASIQRSSKVDHEGRASVRDPSIIFHLQMNYSRRLEECWLLLASSARSMQKTYWDSRFRRALVTKIARSEES